MLRSKQRKWMFIFIVVALQLSMLCLSGWAQELDSTLANLRSNPKLASPDEIVSDFANGASETAVIVTLQPTEEAKALAAKSRLSPHAAELAGQGAATYYDLQDEAIRSQLQETVSATVNRALDEVGSSGVTVTQRFTYQFGFAAKVTPEALERILALPGVVTVEKDRILLPHLAQGIPLMNASAARSTYIGSGVSIAITDTGIDTSHPRLGGGGFPNAKVIGGYDTGDNDSDPRPGSFGEAHGTACAGIAAGDTGTVGDYIGGVAPGAKLYSIKISQGSTGSASSSSMIAAWEWAVTHKNDNPNNPILIISTSFGGGSYTSACDSASPSMTTAAANAVAAGITIFASSGNEGTCGSMAWPACISYVNSVGAVYDANFGTYLPCVTAASCAAKIPTTGCATGYYVIDNTSPNKVTAYSNSASFLTLFAPSNQAYTTDIVGTGGYSSGDYDTQFGGTSAACPYAAGAAAVLQQAAKVKKGAYLTPAQVRSYLVSNGDNVTDTKIAVTKPRINLGRAVDALGTPSGNLTVSGTVHSGSATGPLLSGATVSLGSRSVVTSSTGTFSITGLAPGTYTLTVSKSGYFTKSSSYMVTTNISNLTLFLIPGYTLSGTVHVGSTTGPLLAGATVSFAGKTATTSTTGTFSITGLAAGTYTLTVSKPGYTTKSSPYTITGNVSGLHLFLTPGYTFSGTVRIGSTTGPVLAGATVAIAGKTATTSSTGTFSITGLTAGTYTLTVSKAGYITKSSSYTVTGNVSGLNLFLVPSYSMSGIVHQGSATGPVLAGATVAIAGKTAISTSTGAFSITGIPAGTYTLTVSKTGFVTKTTTGYVVRSNQSGLNFYLLR